MDYLTPILISILILAVLGIAIALVARDTAKEKGVWGINFKKVNCPKCGATMPPIRTPTSLRQAAWGGWTCQQCGCETDKWGAEIKQINSSGLT